MIHAKTTAELAARYDALTSAIASRKAAHRSAAKLEVELQAVSLELLRREVASVARHGVIRRAMAEFGAE